MRTPILKTVALALLAGSGLVGVSTQAGTATFTFDTDPRTDPQFIISSSVNDGISGLDFYEGANGNPGGYIAITRSANSQISQVLFPDFDSGLIVKAFTFECDLRLGNPTGNNGLAADGFSISYARGGDPAVANLTNNPATTDMGQYAGGAAENGTQTGIAISFDTWAGNNLPDIGRDWPGTANGDPGGIHVRVDNVTVRSYRMPTLNGPCADVTSLQTGPYDAAADAAGQGGAYTNLCWQRLRVQLAENGELTVTYKGTNLLNNFQTGYAPSAGRLLMAGRTGGANENNLLDNVTITTIPADKFLIGNVVGNAYGFQFAISDSGPSVLNPSTLVVRYDGNTVTPTSVNKIGAITTVDYTDLTTRLAAGSSHTLEVTAQDTPAGATVTRTQSYTTPAYALVPVAWKVAGTPTTPGMKAVTHFIDETAVTGFTGRYPGNENTIPNAEQQLAKGYIDPSTGQPYPNTASPENNDITLVNWDEFGADIDANNPDNFNTVEPVGGPVPNDLIPGVDVAGNNNNGVAEVVAYVQLTKGVNRMGVNSDDGFKVTAAPGQPSVTGVVLGQFNDGRGASDSIFEFVVDEDGYYALRLLWWEGEGGANCEWFSVNRATGEKILINGAPAASLKAFRTGAGRAVLKSLLPADGYTGANPNVTVKAELIDGTTTVVDGSVSLVIDGSPVTATVVNGATTTVTWTPSPPFAYQSSHTGSLIWTESTTPTPTIWTNNFSFAVRPIALADLAATSFWIEAEDFDGTGQDSSARATANAMPYAGGAYTLLGATHDVDYHANDTGPFTAGVADGYNYRTGIPAQQAGPSRFVPMDANATTATLDVQRPGNPIFEATENYKIGWTGGGEWYNFTRTIPNGIYKAVAALSHGDPAGTPNRLQGSLARVSSGVGTSNQTTVVLGSFDAPSSGGWGANNLVEMKTSIGEAAVFKITGGGATTFRFNTQNGDFDWFVLVPTTSPAKLRTGPPLGTAPFSIPHTLTWVLDDFSTTINVASAALKIDGATVTAPAFTVTKNGDVTTATYVADIGNVHTYEFSINDSAGATIATSGTFIGNYMTPSPAPASMFLIEGEDFNFGGGQTTNIASVMPYLGNAYNGLSAVMGVDYNHADDGAGTGNIYRLGETNNVPFSAQNDDNGLVRARDAAGAATWTLTTNYRLGWAGGNNWMNYTRQIPAGTYQVWASMSHGDPVTSAAQIQGNLSRVTSDPTQPSQTIEPVGYFRGPLTGGWGANQLFPLRSSASEATGNAAVVTLGGATPSTLRFEYANGDFDYFILVSTTPPLRLNPPAISGGQVTISWTGTGTLQQTDSLSPPNWGAAPSQVNPQTVSASGVSRYYRLQQ